MTAISRRAFLAAAAVAPLATTIHAADGPKFKPGLVTYNVPKDWDLATILRICKSAGLAAVECRTTHKHGVEPSLSTDERAKVKKHFEDSGIVFWGCGSVCEFHSAEPAVVKKNIEDCKQFLELVAALGGKGVKVRPNGVAKGHTLEQACTQIGTALKECGKTAKDLNLEIFVEVHGATTQIPKNMRTILDVCNHPAVGACWNSNATDLDNGSLDANFDLLKKHLKACHINDLENDAKGKYPYRQLFKKLKEIGYDRYTLCEVNKSFDPVAGEKYLKEYVAKWRELTS